MKKIIFTNLLLLYLFNINAQTPHLIGNVKISIINGTFESDLVYTNIPNIENYSIWLNKEFNIQSIKINNDTNSTKYKKVYNEKSYESFQYQLKNIKTLPSKLYFKYFGNFKVNNDIEKFNDFGDWKGNIAFNGKNVRASEQTAWYPIIYDNINYKILDKVTYNITIDCKDCNSIYLNGSKPIKNNIANFKSDKPFTLMLFAGIFDFSENENSIYINTKLNNERQNMISNWTDNIIKSYENRLNIPYGNSIVYLHSTPVTKKNNWMFVTFPTIAIISPEENNLNYIFKGNSNELKDLSYLEIFIHEIGHYYIGTYFVPNSELRWFFLEGLTEYIALKIVKDVLGANNYKNKLKTYIHRIKELKPKPLSKVKSKDINVNYRYDYAPLLLTVLENELGEEQIWNWIKLILNSDKNTITDYTFFKTTLIKSGIDINIFNSYEKEYINSKDAKENVIKYIDNLLIK